MCLSAFSIADISYKVSVVQGETDGHLHVEMTIPTGTGREVIECPVWEPGAYDEGDYGKRVQNFAVVNSDGSSADSQHPDFSTWVVEGKRGSLLVSYDIPARISNNQLHYSGPATYLYVKGRKEEPCHLDMELPTGWKLAIGLDPEGKTPGHYYAPTYDVFADTPVTMGDITIDQYMSHGKPHYIALYGQGVPNVDQKFLIKACKYVSDAEGTFFGEVPYKRYVWHFNTFNAPDGGGGLEHLNGTEITLSSGVGPGMQGVLMHEFFHLWNVKRIRSKVLGPFDYTQLPRTGALWWLEGVTDYYAHTLETRYGWAGPDRLYGSIASNYQSVENNPAHLQVSPYDASFRVRDAGGGRGNSNGLNISYYNLGWLGGLLLDIDIRSHTGNRKTLDDVELALWKECRNNQPGFQEDEIRNLCEKIGGPEVAKDFDAWIMNPGELPVADSLKKIGLSLVTTQQERPKAPFSFGPNMDESKPAMVVTDPGTTDLKKGDQVLSYAGIDFTSQAGMGSLFRKMRDLKPGDKVPITVKRDGQEVNATVTIGSQEFTVYSVTADPNASKEAKGMLDSWLSPRPGTQKVYDKYVFDK